MIDWDRVSALADEFGDDGFAEVVTLFLEEADEVAQGLLAGLPLDQVEARLHFLKGSALNLGFTDLAFACQEGERAAARGTPSGVDLARVAAIYDASKAALLAGLRSRSAA